MGTKVGKDALETGDVNQPLPLDGNHTSDSSRVTRLAAKKASAQEGATAGAAMKYTAAKKKGKVAHVAKVVVDKNVKG